MANQDKKTEDDPDNGQLPDRPEKTIMKNQEEVQERLGFGLRSMYRSVLEEPLPDDMIALLDQLDDSEDSPDSRQQPGPNPSE